jgi:hypothetical protein
MYSSSTPQRPLRETIEGDHVRNEHPQSSLEEEAEEISLKSLVCLEGLVSIIIRSASIISKQII